MKVQVIKETKLMKYNVEYPCDTDKYEEVLNINDLINTQYTSMYYM